MGMPTDDSAPFSIFPSSPCRISYFGEGRRLFHCLMTLASQNLTMEIDVMQDLCNICYCGVVLKAEDGLLSEPET
jgi:hypothetical protein